MPQQITQSKKDLRKDFFQILEELMEKDKDIVFITFDLGYSFFENIKRKFPDRFLNAGCIEGAGIGIAAGMARAGKKPFVYSNTIFLLFRALEQVRDDICYNNLDVKLIGTGAAGFLGFSHNLSEKEKEFVGHIPFIYSYFPENGEQLKHFMGIKGHLFIQL